MTTEEGPNDDAVKKFLSSIGKKGGKAKVKKGFAMGDNAQRAIAARKAKRIGEQPPREDPSSNT